MTTATVNQVGRDDWAAIVARFADANYQQLGAYLEELAATDGAGVGFYTVSVGSELLGATGVRVKRVPLLGRGIVYVAGGPMIRCDGVPFDPTRLAQVCDALKREFTDKQGHLLRTAPTLTGEGRGEECDAAMRDVGFEVVSDARPYRTFLIDVSRQPEAMMESFSHYWRRNLRRGEKHGHKVRFDTNIDAFEPLISLHESLVARKQFFVRLDGRFYQRVQSGLGDAERLIVGRVLDARGEALSSIVFSELGDTSVGIVGATSNDGAKSYASYTLFWAIMRRAHEAGLKWFDLGGIDPNENESVFNFKSGMRGIDVSAPGPYEATPGALTTTLVSVAEKAKRRLRERSARLGPMNGNER